MPPLGRLRQISKDRLISSFEETATSAVSMLPVGARLAGRYRILDVIGAGGMGIVYQAQDDKLDVPIAIKVLRPERRLDEATLERFRGEIRLARKVTHPNVVRIHDIGQDGDLLFLTMDYMEGRTLREQLANGPLATDKALSIARDMAEALAAAHDVGIVHRDLKPGNIITSDDGRAWLTDFGVARAFDDKQQTVEGVVIGTPNYLSPEQIRGETVDGRADIYAMGIVLYEMISGAVPLCGDTIEETAARRAAGREADITPLKDAPAGVVRIIKRCLESKPEDRYQDARELAADLAQGGANLRLKKTALWAGAAGLIVLTVAMLAYLAPPFTKNPTPATETVEKQSAQRIAILPFVNHTGLAEFDWISRGLPESLSSSLAENADLQVVDSQRVFQTLDAIRVVQNELSDSDMRQISALLDVSAVIKGVVIGGDQDRRLELTIRRTPEGTEQTIRTDIGPGGLLAAIDLSIGQLLKALQITSPDHQSTPSLSANVAAMDAYSDGVAQLARGESLLAIDSFRKSIAADNNFGLAHTALVRAYTDAGRWDEAVSASQVASVLLEKSGGRAALLMKAQQALLRGETETGVELLQQLVSQYPNDLSAKTLLAEQLGALGRFKEAQEQLEDVVAVDSNHPRAWFLRGKFAAISGDPKTAAEDYYVRALIIQNRLGSAQGRGEVFNAMGIAHEQLGELDVARQYYRNALEMRTNAEDQRGVAGTLSNIARLDMIQGDFNSARKALEQSLSTLNDIGDLNGVAGMHNELGLLEEEAGDYVAALERYREALRIRRGLNDSLDLAESYVNLAFTYLVLGEYDNAGAFARNAYQEFDAAGADRGKLMAREIEGELHAAEGDWNAALNAFVKNLESSRNAGNPFSEAVAEGGLGLIAAYQGNPKTALEAWNRAQELLRPLEDARGLAEYQLRKAELLVSLSAFDAAQATLEETSQYLDEAGSVAQRSEFLRLQGAVAAGKGRAQEANSYLEQAASLAKRTGSRTITLKTDLTRLQWSPATVDVGSVLDRASTLGDAPMRLRALALQAEQQYADGDHEAAFNTAASALRAPKGIETWRDNWRLNLIAAKAAYETGHADATAYRSSASAQLTALIEATPEQYSEGLKTLQKAEGLDVEHP